MPRRPICATMGCMIAFAHRGGARHPDLEGLENTLVAFRHAAALGYTHLETDVHLTADGVLVAFHDDVLDRVTDRQGAIKDLTYAEVRAALIGGREHIPTLDQLVDAFPEASFNIDLKSPEAAVPLAVFIAERHLEDRSLVGSFSPATLRAFRAASGGAVRTSAHPLEVAAYLFAPTGRIAQRLTGGRPAALQVPVRHGRLKVVTPRLIAKAHSVGVAVHVWTVDEPAQVRELAALGVDGMFTDRTDLLREVLLDLGLWQGVA